MSHQLETIIGYKFKNPELLEIALTHTSYANESRTPVKHNERLEFLGDSVLQIVSADYLFHAYADRPEGDLTRIRASLVSEGALFQFAQEINLGEYLRLGRGEERCGGRTRPSVVSDAFEAVIAALYLDGGISDAIPLEKSILDGNRKNIVVMTKEVGFVRKPASASQLGLIKLRYLKYPKVYELMADRHIRYNESLDYIERQEKCGQAFVIRPHKKSDVGRIEKDKDKLIALYEEGYREAEACYEDLLAYLEK